MIVKPNAIAKIAGNFFDYYYLVCTNQKQLKVLLVFF